MTTSSILDGHVKESIFSAENGPISTKTSARYRQMGMPYMVWGGEIYIDVAGARQWLLDRTRRRKSASRPRQQVRIGGLRRADGD